MFLWSNSILIFSTVSRTNEADLKFIDPTNIIDNATARDLRLGFMSKMLEAVEEGCMLRLHSPANFEPFYIESQQVIRTLACVNCYIKPLPSKCLSYLSIPLLIFLKSSHNTKSFSFLCVCSSFTVADSY